MPPGGGVPPGGEAMEQSNPPLISDLVVVEQLGRGAIELLE